MKGSDVISRLVQQLPLYTDFFTPKFTITSLMRSGGTVTGVTDVAHGITTGNVVVITGAKSPITITSLTQVDGIATAVTSANHDLTEGWEGQEPSDDPNVFISGADQAEYNGTHALLDVPNRRTFKFSVDDSAVTPATGSPKLLEQFNTGYNGQHVATVVNATTFTYPITTTPESPAQGTIEVAKGSRISGAVDFDALLRSYTKQKLADDLWAFVVIDDTVANKDRRDDTDATFTQGGGVEFRQRIITPFSVYVAVPATSEKAGRAARDKMHDVRLALFKVLLRAIFSDGFTARQVFTTAFNSDGFVLYSDAVYWHRFVFEIVSDITYGDTAAPDEHVAFRDVALEFNDEEGTTELSVTVDLDDEPFT